MSKINQSENIRPKTYLKSNSKANSFKEISLAEIAVNKDIYDQHFDIQFARNFVKNIIDPIESYYFRSEFYDFELVENRLEKKHPIIFAANHSGMAFPWDAMIFTAGLFKRVSFKEEYATRAITAPQLSKAKLMSPYLIPDLWKKVGAIDASFLNFETMMHYPNSHILIYPEGIPGIGKGFNNKYKIQQPATSFIKMSLKYKTEIQLFSTVNGEYINPFTYSFNFINKYSNKIGLAFLPVGFLTIFLIFQPWLFYYAWPANLKYQLGSRIKPFEWTSKNYEELSQEEIRGLRDKVHRQMQIDLDNAVLNHGKKPFNLRTILKHFIKNRKYYPAVSPIGWPVLFEEYHRQFKIHGMENIEKVNLKFGWRNFIKWFLRNPFSWFYYIPILGWIPILIRGLKSDS